jgi:hypothetical protein
MHAKSTALLALVIATVTLVVPAQRPAANQLTSEEQAESWMLLFDGRTWANWTLSKHPATTWWKIEDGWIQSIPRGEDDGTRRLATLESFRDFELQFEWKVSKAGNSGVKYRIQRIWQFEPEHLQTGIVKLAPVTLKTLEEGTALGFEYQLTDDENAPDALDSPARSSAAMYRLIAPQKERPVVADTVHSSRIRVIGSRVEHWLDGKMVLEGDLRSETVRAVLQRNRESGTAKFKGATNEQDRYNGLLEQVTAESLLRYDVAESPIDFQHHLSGVAFRM